MFISFTSSFRASTARSSPTAARRWPARFLSISQPSPRSSLERLGRAVQYPPGVLDALQRSLRHLRLHARPSRRSTRGARAMPSLDDASTNGRPSRFRRDSTRARGGTDDSRVVDERGDCDAPFHDVGRAPTRRARACAVARASATAAHLKNIIYNGKIALLTQKHQETPFPMEKRLDGSTRHSAANSRGGARERLRARRGNVKIWSPLPGLRRVVHGRGHLGCGG